MLDEKYIGLIDDYLDGILDQQSKESLEKELNESAELRDLLAIIQLSRESIKLSGQKEMISKIHENFKQASTKDTGKSKSFMIKPWWIGIAASLTLFLLAGNFWVNTQADDFFANHYMAYELPTMRSGEILENEVEDLYREKDFESVIAKVDLTSDVQSDLFLASLAHIELTNYSTSVQYLRRIQQLNETKSEPEKFFQEETDYYLFLVLLKMNDIEEADKYFNRITENKSHAFYQSLGSMDKLRFSVIKKKNKN